jgi:hypothetical protein
MAGRYCSIGNPRFWSVHSSRYLLFLRVFLVDCAHFLGVFYPGDTLTFINNVLPPLQSAQQLPTASTNVTVQAPLNPPVPVLVVSAPAIHNPCLNLVLDASMSYNTGNFYG